LGGFDLEQGTLWEVSSLATCTCLEWDSFESLVEAWLDLDLVGGETKLLWSANGLGDDLAAVALYLY
jgi:hypothetical protein